MECTANVRSGMAPARLMSLALCLAAVGCATAQKINFSSDPEGAFVQVDGQNVGTAPVSYTLDFARKMVYNVTATKAGFFSETVMLTPESPEVGRGDLRLVLMEDEAWKVTTTSEATNAWLRIQVDAKLAHETVWQKLVDSVTGAYSSLEQLDNASGYMRSIATMRKFKGPRGEFRVRTRFIGSIASKEPLVYKLKIEAEVTDSQGDWVPYSRVFKTDAALIDELQSRLGMK